MSLLTVRITASKLAGYSLIFSLLAAYYILLKLIRKTFPVQHFSSQSYLKANGRPRRESKLRG